MQHLFRPSLLMFNLMRYATPHDSIEDGLNDFKDDVAWFKAHKHRSQVIRKASFAEFETFDAWQNCGKMGIPRPLQLWVMVIRSGASNHIIVPIWLGDRYFPTDNSLRNYDTCETDDALQVILHYINHNKGYDELEFRAWAQQVQSALNDSTAMQDGTVN